MSGRVRAALVYFATGLSLVWAPWLAAQSGLAPGENYRAGNAAAPSETSTPTRMVTGRVTNALTGAAVSRALVNLNSRAVLTDAQGRFTFPSFDAASGYVQVTKPGYSSSASFDNIRQQKLTSLDAELDLRLFPDALLTGVVTGPDGLPLARTQIRLRRLAFDGSGPHWLQAGFTQTDVHGAYRLSVPGGQYRLSTGFTARSVERGESVLPVAFPAVTPTNAEAFQLTSGEQSQIDFRPRVSAAYPIKIQLDGADNDQTPRLVATGASGISFPLATQRNGDELTAQLPAGSFLLRATTGDRGQAEVGEARVAVSAREPAKVVLHVAPVPVFPVEVAFEVVALAGQSALPATPSPQQFNLSLHNLANGGLGFDQDARLNVKPDRTAEFDVMPGRYRLGAGLNGAWYIRSASNGVTDLLSEELVVAPASAGTPIRLTVSNAVGTLKGTVKVAGQPASGWVYLVPLQPTLILFYEVFVQSDGSYRWSGAPGKYVAVPSAEQVHEDFRSPAFLRSFESAGRAVEVTAAADTLADLTLAPAGVPR